MATDKTKAEKELTVEERLSTLYKLQIALSKIDRIKTLRGELPLEVQDLEDEIAGLETRIQNFRTEIDEFQTAVSDKKNEIQNAKVLIEKYSAQQDNVRNNKEYDFLSKEIEFQTLEIELCEKRIREFTATQKSRQEDLESCLQLIEDRKADLSDKKGELDEIVSETKQEEEQLREEAKQLEALIEPRLLTAFKRIRKNARNGLSVVAIERDACGGCFNKIPPQRQMDIKLRKKIIVCEYCGRIIIDPDMAKEISEK